jgi:hypothetical protein
MGLFHSLSYPPDSQTHNGSPFKPFSDPLNMKILSSDLVTRHAR